MDITKAMKIKLQDELPLDPMFEQGIRRAPNRIFNLNLKVVLAQLLDSEKNIFILVVPVLS